MIILETIFLGLLLILFLPVLLFSLQVLLSLPLFGRKPAAIAASARPSIAVLVPAHNESAGILPTLQAIQARLQAGDRLLVVADNCTDDTAELAASAGAEVIERHDSARRGKGYALDYGVRYLEFSPPDVLIIVDADCMVHGDSLQLLARQCLQTNSPAQAMYLMQSPVGAGLKTRVAEFAWAVKNRARPLAYQRCGLPCQLMGTGMAFPWELIQAAELASGHIVEDLKLGLDFAAAGHAPQLCSEALVTSVFPANTDGAQSQRTRWEHGHLGMILTDGPWYFASALRTMNGRLLALVLDMCVPPLALLTLLVVLLALLAAVMSWLSGAVWPWSLAIFNLLLLGIAVLLAWLVHGRHILSFSHLAYAPFYALAKVPLYLRFIFKRQVDWVRSRRDQS
ncbi:MAG: glycosyl transferase [Betaproteobacteria bacterium HGW-Betaproteobacteria-15]|nr:MAG: glycosyl transferase [Betaproteobacteria bacterium HGW-Betaproteobacteria-15]